MTSPLLVLIGPPAAGKSRIGSTVARLLGVRFVDTDRTIVREHAPIPQLFAEHGEAHFRGIERETVQRALTGRLVEAGEDFVVALGGGAVLDPDTQADLASHRVALITVSAEAVRDRLNNAKRPLLTGGIEAWQRLVDERRAIYESLADAAWDTSTVPVTRVAHQVAEWVRHEAQLTEVTKEPIR